MADEPTTPPADAPAEETPAAPAGPRVSAAYYIGETDPVTNEPVQYVLGVPARDLTEDDIRVLSDAEYQTAMACGIYAETKPSKKKGA